MLRGNDEIRRTKHRIRAGREYVDLPTTRCFEQELRAFTAADPVTLEQLGGSRPIDLIEIREQPLGEVGDAEKPLLQRALLDRGAAALAAAVDHLLVREDGLVLGAPVHRRALFVREAGVVQLQEQPLGPLVIGGVRRRELVPPIEHATEAAELPPKRRDVLRDQLGRVGPDRERVVFRVDPECIEPHRLEDVIPLEALEPTVNVGARKGEHVADV